jgi:hypothetical protein
MSQLIYHFTPEEFREQMARAWRQGYEAGWKDQTVDFPAHTTDNPYSEATA